MRAFFAHVYARVLANRDYCELAEYYIRTCIEDCEDNKMPNNCATNNNTNIVTPCNHKQQSRRV